MRNLEKDWLTAGLIDFEYKKYLLLAYLQSVKTNFKEKKLYPDLSDLQRHYEYSLYFKDGLQQMAQNFPKRIKGVDADALQVNYEEVKQPENEVLAEIQHITEYALPRFRYSIEEGKELLSKVEKGISIAPIGVLPLYKNEGYLFLYEPCIQETRIYQFNLTIFENNHEKCRGLKTFYIDTVRRSMANTFENMKIDLVKKYRHLPNPATFLVESSSILPLEETFLPIAQRKVVEMVSAA